mgnify:CR=1 FL=1
MPVTPPHSSNEGHAARNEEGRWGMDAEEGRG